MEIIREEDLKPEVSKVPKAKKEHNFSSSLGLFFLRLIFGSSFLLHGFHKVQNLHSSLEGIKNLLIEAKIPDFLAYGVFIGEVLAPLFIIIGFYTRISSAIVFFNCLVILYVTQIKVLAFDQVLNIFTLGSRGEFANELVFLYIACSLCLIFTGSGKIAVRKS